MPHVQVSASPEVAHESRKFVLLVEDGADSRDLYAEYLDFCGFRVETARDGRQALVLAEQDVPDLIVMDLKPPLPAGWDAIRALKNHQATAGVPIIAVSAQIGEAAARAKEAGADVCLPKPCLPSQLARAIRAMLVWRRSAAL